MHTLHVMSELFVVVLQDNNYKIIKKVKGEASGMSVFGIFGGSFRPLVEQARSQMLASANLIGKSRAIINETVEVNNKFFLVVGFKTVTVSAYVIEFTDAGTYEAVNITPAATETTLVIEENAVIENITGKWIRTDGLEITIDGDIGVLSQIKSGDWLILLKKGKVRIGEPKFKDITKTEKLTWQCQELVFNFFNVKQYQSSTLTLNKTGDILRVSDRQGSYTLLKVKE